MLTLHFAPNSRASRTLWLLEELGLEYELNRMDFHPKDLSPTSIAPAIRWAVSRFWMTVTCRFTSRGDCQYIQVPQKWWAKARLR
ncbi:MAG: hypothetical protein CM15mP103_13140 [Gammaproteobacteria bacterium]|nr:MAG: hypothetical protein CM15mP103_13140 [Gammaproteobacteria bacterium]